jgi:diphthamide biosynthesis protein 4
MQMQSHYDVLGVAADADVATIKDAYHSRLLRLHPDKCAPSAATATAFDAVQRAWHTLREPTSRAAYDASLRERQMLAAPISVVTDVDLDDMRFDEATRTFRHDCRCGELFVISEEQLAAGLDGPVACHGCSLQIRVLFEEAAPL